jgi:HK97 family phage major capsid protein
MEFTEEMKKAIEEDAKLTNELRENFEKFKDGFITKADYEEKDKKIADAIIELKKRTEALETANARPDPNDDDKDGETKDLKEGQAEYKKAFFDFLRTGKIDLSNEKAAKYFAERKALVSDTTGQILIPEELESEIYRALPKINIIRKYATIRTITRDRIRRRSMTEVSMGWGKLELGKEVVETDVVPSEDYQYVEDLEGLARVGKDELADTDVSLEALIVDSFSRAKAETEETAYISGTGHANEQPDGILNGTTVTRVTTAAADAIAVDDMLNLIYAVPAQYRRNGRILVPSTTELALRKLKSATEELYLWQPNVQAGQPATFAGYPLEAQEDIPAINSSAQCDVAIFGDIRAGYRILDRQGMTIQWLRELYATGGVIRADALRVLREHA